MTSLSDPNPPKGQCLKDSKLKLRDKEREKTLER